MVLIIGSIVAGVVLIFVVVPALVHRASKPALERRIAEHYQPDQIVLQDFRALSLGLESRGVTQGRGNGALVLTADTLHWFQLIPESSSVKIPRDQIVEVKSVKSHLGKSIGRSLLHVTFTVDGKRDSMAWNVMDLDTWLGKLGPQVPEARVVQ